MSVGGPSSDIATRAVLTEPRRNAIFAAIGRVNRSMHSEIQDNYASLLTHHKNGIAGPSV